MFIHAEGGIWINFRTAGESEKPDEIRERETALHAQAPRGLRNERRNGLAITR